MPACNRRRGRSSGAGSSTRTRTRGHRGAPARTFSGSGLLLDWSVCLDIDLCTINSSFQKAKESVKGSTGKGRPRPKGAGPRPRRVPPPASRPAAACSSSRRPSGIDIEASGSNEQHQCGRSSGTHGSAATIAEGAGLDLFKGPRGMGTSGS